LILRWQGVNAFLARNLLGAGLSGGDPGVPRSPPDRRT